MFVFGAGLIWATPTQTATGDAVENPTPLLVGVVQETSFEFTDELKTLYGQSKYPVDIASGKSTIKGTIKAAGFTADLFNTMFFGFSVEAGGQAVVGMTEAVEAEVSVTVTPPNSGTFTQDLGVVNAETAKFLKRVASAPKSGEYAVSDTGVYTFAEDDVDMLVYINYKYTSESIKGKKIELTNQEMGYKPTFALDCYCKRDGKTMLVSFDKCVSDSLKMALKSDDFAIPEMSYQAMANANGHVGRIQVME